MLDHRRDSFPPIDYYAHLGILRYMCSAECNRDQQQYITNLLTENFANDEITPIPSNPKNDMNPYSKTSMNFLPENTILL